MNVAPSRASTSFSRPGLLCWRRSRGAETLNRSRRADDERRLPSGAWACGGSPAKADRAARSKGSEEEATSSAMEYALGGVPAGRTWTSWDDGGLGRQYPADRGRRMCGAVRSALATRRGWQARDPREV